MALAAWDKAVGLVRALVSRRLRPRDLVGYCALQFVFHVPVVLFLVWALNYTLPYVAPILAHSAH